MMPKVSSRFSFIEHSSDEDENNSSSSTSGIVPTDKDVLCGRGRTNFYHEGNKRFREIVGKNLQTYLSAPSRTMKSRIVRSIADEILEGGARFLKYNENGSMQWHESGINVAREKVGHALRDASSDKSRAIKKIHLDHEQRKKKSKTGGKKGRSSSSKMSVADAAKLSFLDTPLELAPQAPQSGRGATTNNSFGSTMQDANCGGRRRSLRRASRARATEESTYNPDHTTSLEYDDREQSRVVDELANNFAADESSVAECLFSEDLLRDLVNLPARLETSPCGSLDDYLEAVNDIELDDLEAYLSHALDCTTQFAEL